MGVVLSRVALKAIDGREVVSIFKLSRLFLYILLQYAVYFLLLWGVGECLLKRKQHKHKCDWMSAYRLIYFNVQFGCMSSVSECSCERIRHSCYWLTLRCTQYVWFKKRIILLTDWECRRKLRPLLSYTQRVFSSFGEFTTSTRLVRGVIQPLLT